MKAETAPDRNPLLSVRDLERHFPSGRGLAPTSFDLGAGETLGLAGENGAGKSTLLDLITGVTSPDRGTLWLCGSDVTRWAPHRRARLGLRRTFQFSAPVSALRVRDYVSGFLLHQHASWRQDCLARLATLGISPRRRIATLSGGERRILDVALCIISRGRVLLFDEPFAGVDVATVARLLTLMTEMPQGVASLVVDHDPARLAGLCSRVIQLRAPVRDAA